MKIFLYVNPFLYCVRTCMFIVVEERRKYDGRCVCVRRKEGEVNANSLLFLFYPR